MIQREWFEPGPGGDVEFRRAASKDVEAHHPDSPKNHSVRPFVVRTEGGSYWLSARSTLHALERARDLASRRIAAIPLEVLPDPRSVSEMESSCGLVRAGWGL